jgi:Ca2+-binding EF-hand superfamily protein
MFIFNNLTTSEEKNELLETFKKLDTNNNGKLSK